MREGWTYKKLGEVCEVLNGFAFKSNLFETAGLPILRISNLQNNVVTENGIVFFSKSSYPKINLEKYKVNPYDILIAMSGATTGKVAVNLTNRVFYLNQRVGLIRENSSIVKKNFLFYFLIAKSADNLEMALGVAQPNLSTKQIKDIQIPVPPLAEQERIVAELDLLSGIIEKKKEQLKAYDQLAQSIFHNMFSKEQAIKHEWRECCIGDIYKFQYGKGNRIPEDKGDYLCYGSNGVVGHHVTYNSENAPIIGHIGAYAGIVNWGAGKHYVTYNGVICTLKDVSNNPTYGFYLLKSQDYLSAAKRGGAQPFVSYDLLEAPTIFLPPLSLQQEFAETVEAIERQKALVQQSIDETQTMFDYTMDKYFG